MSPPADPIADPVAARLDPLLGRIIAGNFRIERLLGSGAMGNVYKAEQLSLGKAVAIKVLHAHLMSDDKLVRRFKREAKSASLLNHPNSIQIIDSGQDQDGTLYIAMELLTGRDLAHVIRDDFPLPVTRIVRIMSQVLSALEEAHIQGVIHRDLKPSNIMLIERRGEVDFVKVCDFGIAKAAQDAKDDRESMLTIQGLVCGTPEYMAPEQARGELLDGRADLYAAAVILFQLVTGDIPFKGDTPMAIVSRHLVEAPAVPSRRRNDVPIPAALDALILKGMEKNRELRFENAAAFREALDAVGAGEDDRPRSASGLRAQMPTGRITGSSSDATAVIPSSDPANHFGSTTQLPRRSRKVPFVAGLAVIIGGLVTVIPRLQQKIEQVVPQIAQSAVAPRPSLQRPTAANIASAPQPAAGVAAPTGVAPATPAPAAAPAIAPTAEEPPPPSPLAATPATRTPAAAVAATKTAHHRKGPDHAAPGEPAPGADVARPGVVPAVPAVAGVAGVTGMATATNPPTAEPASATRGVREVITEAEKLLGQGETGEACARGEEAKRMSPRLAPIYKFLGKCYMRAGNASQANDNYKKYLELAPNASDAMFIKSIIK